MGDQDGSSSAAQSAQPETQTQAPGGDTSPDGVLSRLIRAFGGGAQDMGSAVDTPPRINGAAQVPGMLNLRRMRVEDVMLPRVEIVSVAVDMRKDDLVEVFRESGLTRLPVYNGTLDTPVGMVHLKDFALSHGFNGNGGRFSMRRMLRPLLFAPPSMPIGVLLQKMQSERTHLALVIDEYGGVDGLVTIEDLIEQVIGEIEDEHDTTEGNFWVIEKPGCFLAQAKTPLAEFEAAVDRRLISAEDEEEIDTLGGLVFMLAGRVPARGEVIHHPDGPDFEVVDADPRRIKRLRVRLNDPPKDG